MPRFIAACALSAVALLAAAPAWSQAQVPAQDPPPHADAVKPDGPTDRQAAEDTATPARPSESLSDRLARTDGVIAPPSTSTDGQDPILRPAPDAGPQSTPTIPPPGEPGGTQGVDPK